MSFGDKCECLEPLHIREDIEMKRRVHDIAALYENEVWYRSGANIAVPIPVQQQFRHSANPGVAVTSVSAKTALPNNSYIKATAQLCHKF